MGENMTRERNRAIDFYRFLFSLVVALLHYRGYSPFGESPTAFYGGYLAVEFFFILSGYFIMDHIEREFGTFAPRIAPEDVPERTLHFFVERFKRLFPDYALALLLVLLFEVVINHSLSVKQVLIDGGWEFLMVQCFGFPYHNYTLWYCSALLFASVFVYFLVLRFGKGYIYLGAPVVILSVVGFFLRKVGHIDVGSSINIGLLWDGFYRAVAEIGLGCICYCIVEKLRSILNGHNIIILQTGFEMAIVSFIFFIMWRTRRDMKDFVMIVVIAAFVISLVVQKSYLSKALDKPLFGYLGRISYAIYVNQLFIMFVTHKYFSEIPYWPQTMIFLCILILFSAVTNKICDSTVRYIKKRLGKEKTSKTVINQ